jgi:hypothetical protein
MILKWWILLSNIKNIWLFWLMELMTKTHGYWWKRTNFNIENLMNLKFMMKWENIENKEKSRIECKQMQKEWWNKNWDKNVKDNMNQYNLRKLLQKKNLRLLYNMHWEKVKRKVKKNKDLLRFHNNNYSLIKRV